MNITSDQVFIEALSLPTSARAELIERLSTSLEGSKAQEEIDGAWIIEIERRCKACDEGKMKEIDGEEVMQGLRERLKTA
jgi:putative addiction module component (TIGR02574 family)